MRMVSQADIATVDPVLVAQSYEFLLRVLLIFQKVDDYDEALTWGFNNGYPQLYVNCSDIFDLASSDFQEITFDNVHVLEQTYTDVSAVVKLDQAYYTTYIFCGRVRGRRPLRRIYLPSNKALWPLFDSCGPERD